MSILPAIPIENNTESLSKEKYQEIPFKVGAKLPEDHSLELLIHQAIKASGAYSLSPFSFNWNQYARIYSLCAVMKRFTNGIRLSTCRIDAKAKDPYLPKLINHFSGVKCTIAIEGLSQRIRNFLDKSITTEEIMAGMDSVIAANFSSIKIYYIYTGLEQKEDLEEFEEMLHKFDELKKIHNKPTLTIRVSFTPLISTLGTPTQYHPSDIGRSLKSDNAVIHKIKMICSRFSIPMRLSTAIAASELSQIVEFTDRRAGNLFTHLSLNGVLVSPRPSITLYRPAKENEEIVKILDIDGRRIPVSRFEKISISKLYTFINENQFFSEELQHQLVQTLIEHQGKKFPESLLPKLPGGRAKGFKDLIVHLSFTDPEDLVATYSNGKSVMSMVCDQKTQEGATEAIKRLLPIATNGQTFSDIISAKQPLTIFASSHVKHHPNKHLATDLRKYLISLNGAYNRLCFNTNSCKSCGKCETNHDIKHVTSSTIELGKDHFWKMSENSKPTEPVQKLWISMEVSPGPYAAITPRALKLATIRGILHAVDEVQFTKALLGENPATNTRSCYKIKDFDFKSILSGIFIQELSVNCLRPIAESELSRIMSRINEVSIRGTKIIDVKIKSPDADLRKDLLRSVALMDFVFDDRKVKSVNPSVLQERIRNFLDKNSVVKYKHQRVSGRETVRLSIEDFNKSKVKAISTRISADPNKTILNVVAELNENHPLIFLAGLLGDASPKSYNAIVGTEIGIRGFYFPNNEPSILEQNICPMCGHSNHTNIITGLPFGSDPREQDPILTSKFPTAHPCPICTISI